MVTSQTLGRITYAAERISVNNETILSQASWLADWLACFELNWL